MNWWKRGLLVSAVWMALVIGAGFLITSYAASGKLTPEQDAVISEVCGQAGGAGLVLIWLVSLTRRPKKVKE